MQNKNVVDKKGFRWKIKLEILAILLLAAFSTLPSLDVAIVS